MILPKGATVAVADGAKLLVFKNSGDEARLELSAQPEPAIDSGDRSSGGRHESSSANPDASGQEEDGFAAGAAAWLNKGVLENRIDKLLIIAAPRTLGELRKHYHAKLSAALVGEVAKDLTGHSVAEISTAIGNA